MDESHFFWGAWARFLQRWGLQGTASALLESAGPLNVLLAQLMYLGQPFLPRDHTQALGHMLENKQESRAFAAFLREEDSR